MRAWPCVDQVNLATPLMTTTLQQLHNMLQSNEIPESVNDVATTESVSQLLLFKQGEGLNILAETHRKPP